MKQNELERMIEVLVEKHIKKMLPQVLTEQYLNKVISENVLKHAGNNNAKYINESDNIIEEDVEYNEEDSELKAQNIAEQKAHARKSILEKLGYGEDSPFAMAFEGTDPINIQEAAVPEINLSQTKNALGLDFKRMASLAKVPSKSSNTAKSSINESKYEAEMRRLESIRKSLDISVPVLK